MEHGEWDGKPASAAVRSFSAEDDFRAAKVFLEGVKEDFGTAIVDFRGFKVDYRTFTLSCKGSKEYYGTSIVFLEGSKEYFGTSIVLLGGSKEYFGTSIVFLGGSKEYYGTFTLSCKGSIVQRETSKVDFRGAEEDFGTVKVFLEDAKEDFINVMMCYDNLKTDCSVGRTRRTARPLRPALRTQGIEAESPQEARSASEDLERKARFFPPARAEKMRHYELRRPPFKAQAAGELGAGNGKWRIMKKLFLMAALTFCGAALSGQEAVPAGFVLVEGGTFQMGSNHEWDEMPVHRVTLKSFYMGKYLVTQKAWRELMGTGPSRFKGDNLPVEQVSWYDAVDYCNTLSRKEGLTPAYTRNGTRVSCDWNASGYRLPTEAEWEYAAKGGNSAPENYAYSGSNEVNDVAWYGGNSGNTTHPVGSKAPNTLGLYDMSGNVWEWCWDWYGIYKGRARTAPAGAASGINRVGRGGCWFTSANLTRSAYRSYFSPSVRIYFLGFRVVRSI